MAAKDVWQRFSESFQKCSKISRNKAVHLTILRAVKWQILLPVFPRLIQLALDMSQPFLILGILRFLQNKSADLSNGYAFLLAYALVYTLAPLFNTWFQYLMGRCNSQIRTGLASLIYEKSLERRHTEVGQITTLTDIDVNKVILASATVHMLWSTTVSVGIGAYILYSQLGLVFLIPLGIIALISVVALLTGKTIAARAILSNEASQRRLTALAAIPTSMISIRMLGMTKAVHERQWILRQEEVSAIRETNKMHTWAIVTSMINFVAICLFTFVSYYAVALGGSHNFDIERLFSSLSVLSVICGPMTAVLQEIGPFFDALGGLKRINDFLMLENSFKGAEQCEELDNEKNYDDDGKSFDSDSIISIQQAGFSPDAGKPALLKDINLSIKPGTLTLILGEIGSGKSLLVRSLIGETVLNSGRAQLSRTSTAYCDQPAWIRSATVRENIISEYPFDEIWYARVVWACDLTADIATFESGDLTLIGSKGSTLSGGQKNRITLARAVYARKRVFIADDVLSGLDHDTERKVFRRIFAADGLLRKAGITIIMATHSEGWKRYADQVVTMANLTITNCELNNPDSTAYQGDKDASSTGESSETELEELLPTSAHKTEATINEKAIQAEVRETQSDTRPNRSQSRNDYQSLLYFLRLMGIYHVGGYFLGLIVAIALRNAQSKSFVLFQRLLTA
jgi:ATP-binding cassette subfamily C (CFTR/MRP) protein 1